MSGRLGGWKVEGWRAGRLEGREGWRAAKLEGWKAGGLEGYKTGGLEGWKAGWKLGWKVGGRAERQAGDGKKASGCFKVGRPNATAVRPSANDLFKLFKCPGV